jgi:hypothetical protein
MLASPFSVVTYPYIQYIAKRCAAHHPFIGCRVIQTTEMDRQFSPTIHVPASLGTGVQPTTTF